MKKIAMVLVIISLFFLVACSKNESVYDKYKDKPVFNDCYDEGYSEYLNVKDAGNFEGSAAMREEAYLELMVNACLMELAQSENDKSVCQDLSLEKMKAAYEYELESSGMDIPMAGLPLSTQDLIDECERSIDG